ncbi:unknown [Clostridium sp. CAG:964]|nr:unknown [Clostridium sp. CAG:964]DAQ73965.1 MAG TPA: hypothetical protein [Caudoviricetes sp.]
MKRIITLTDKSTSCFALPDGNTESIIIDNTAKPYVSELTQAIEQFIAATDQLGKISILA